MRKPLAGRRGRSKWRGAAQRCGEQQKEMIVRGVFAGVDRVIGKNGTEEERARTATKESGEAVSVGNVVENMTVPRKNDGQIASTAMLAHDNVGLHGNGHTFRFTNHNNRKGVVAKAALNTKKSRLFITN